MKEGKALFYVFDGKKKEKIALTDNLIFENKIVTGYINANQLKDTLKSLGHSSFSIDSGCIDIKYFRSKIEVYDDYTLVSMRVRQEASTIGPADCIVMYIAKNFFLVVNVFDDDDSIKEKYLDALEHFQSQNMTLEKLMYSFLNNLIEGHLDELSDMELKVSKLEEIVLKDKASEDFNLNLHKMKKEMLLLRNYYSQLIDLGETLQENENSLFPKNELRYFKIFSSKADRLKDKVKLIEDSLVQLADVYKSSLDLKTNNLTRLFTVITAVFLPLTVIVGWYGMNFYNMPELSWKYGYLTCIICSALIVIALTLIFKKKKWF